MRNPKDLISRGKYARVEAGQPDVIDNYVFAGIAGVGRSKILLGRSGEG
jgi:hypothetical protein